MNAFLTVISTKLFQQLKEILSIVHADFLVYLNMLQARGNLLKDETTEVIQWSICDT